MSLSIRGLCFDRGVTRAVSTVRPSMFLNCFAIAGSIFDTGTGARDVLQQTLFLKKLLPPPHICLRLCRPGCTTRARTKARACTWPSWTSCARPVSPSRGARSRLLRGLPPLTRWRPPSSASRPPPPAATTSWRTFRRLRRTRRVALHSTYRVIF